MTRLLKAELTRLWHRRLLWGLAALMLLGVGLVGWVSSIEADSWYTDANGLPLSTMLDSSHFFVTFMATGAALLLGASAIGAEFQAGTMTSWLALEPRRTRVYVTKMLAVAVVVMAFTLVTCLLALLVVWLGLHGVHVVNDLGDVPRRLAGELGRSMALATMAAIGACGLAFATRHTSAVVGLVAGYVVFSAIIFTGLVPSLHRLNLMPYLEAWISGEASQQIFDCGSQAACEPTWYVVTRTDAWLFLGGLSVLCAIIGWVAFTRRDVN